MKCQLEGCTRLADRRVGWSEPRHASILGDQTVIVTDVSIEVDACSECATSIEAMFLVTDTERELGRTSWPVADAISAIADRARADL